MIIMPFNIFRQAYGRIAFALYYKPTKLFLPVINVLFP